MNDAVTPGGVYEINGDQIKVTLDFGQKQCSGKNDHG